MVFRSEVFHGLQALLMILILSSCSGEKSEKYLIGTPIDQFNPKSFELHEEAGQQRFYSFDDYGRRIVFVNPQTRSVEFSPDLGDRTDGQAWLPGAGNSHAFHIKGGRVFVVKANSPAIVEALKVSGTIRSYAAEAKEGLYAFVDEFFSIALLKVDGQGQVVSQWTGGAIIDGATNVVAGEMIAGGKLVLLTDEQSVVVVDVESSLSTQKWVYETIPLPMQSPSWAGKIEGRGDRFLIMDRDSLDLVDLPSKSIVSTQALSSARTSKGGRDHVYLYEPSTDKYSFYSAGTGDAIIKNEVKISGLTPQQTYLSDASLVLTTSSEQILKVRLADGLVQANEANAHKALIGISTDYAVSMFESPLGYLEILDLATGEKSVVQGFNREILQR